MSVKIRILAMKDNPPWNHDLLNLSRVPCIGESICIGEKTFKLVVGVCHYQEDICASVMLS